MLSRLNQYEERKNYYEKEVRSSKSSVSMIGYLRLLTFAVGLGITIYTFFMKLYFIGSILSIVSLGIFIYLVNLHDKVLNEKKRYEIMLLMNEEAIERIQGNWKQFKDTGDEYKDESHGYSGDLDIFGKGSLFQWINTSSTHHGRNKLSSLLANPLKEVLSIKEKQEAVKELSEKLQWRQEFSTEGRLIQEKSSNPDRLIKWALTRHELYSNAALVLFCRVMPVITVALIILSVILKLFSYRIALAAIAIQILMLIPRHVERVLALGTVYLFKKNIIVYDRLLTLIEKEDFKSSILKALKFKLKAANGDSATHGIKELERITDKVSDRSNLFYIIINILFLWDYQCMFQMEKWKKKYGASLEGWLDTIAEFEAISSIAGMAYDNESWVMPEVREHGEILKAKSMAHPLLGSNKVNNDVEMGFNTSILIITGSNMSGKSTFQRTIGLNLILSYIGAPVCAEAFSCSIMNVYTCMRISDNLEKSISSFYAEILRIKMIVEAAKRGEKVFFLLDEIFKGTNSIDRHMGAKLLIKQLGQHKAAGLVSTHDLELGEMEMEYSKIKNFHFQEYYEDGKLKFDYKLRSGISTTRNAMYIIKMAGIDVDNLD